MKWKLYFLISAILGATLGGLMVYVAFQHNPQEEFYDATTGAINNWGETLLLFFSPFLFVMLIALGLWVLIIFLKKLKK